MFALWCRILSSASCGKMDCPFKSTVFISTLSMQILFVKFQSKKERSKPEQFQEVWKFSRFDHRKLKWPWLPPLNARELENTTLARPLVRVLLPKLKLLSTWTPERSWPLKSWTKKKFLSIGWLSRSKEKFPLWSLWSIPTSSSFWRLDLFTFCFSWLSSMSSTTFLDIRA